MGTIKLKVEIKSTRRNQMDLEVRALVKTIPTYAATVYAAKCYFESELKDKKPLGMFHYTNFYVTKMDNEFAPSQLEVWHTDATGERDRLVAVVTYKDSMASYATPMLDRLLDRNG